MKLEYLKILFGGVCWITTATLIIYWLYNYSLNEDLITVNYKKFNEEGSDYYPDLSLCFTNIFFNKKLQELGFNNTSYDNFLRGYGYDPEISNVTIEDVSFRMSDFITMYWIQWRNGTEETFSCSGNCSSLMTSTFSFFSIDRFFTCYILKTPQYKDLEGYQVMLDHQLFRETQYKRPDYEFMTLIHYPNQIMLSKKSAKFNWLLRKDNKNYVMRYTVTDVEVMKRRNKVDDRCDMNWQNHDRNLILQHAKSIGCMPSYQKSSVNIKCDINRHFRH